jgi:FkbM family methyltransferase
MIRAIAAAIQAQVAGRIALGKLGDVRCTSPFVTQKVLNAASRWGSNLPPRFRPRVVLDVGANAGTVSEELFQIYKPEFIGMVEANPVLARGLENRKLNCRTRVFTCAMGERNGTTPFNIVRKGDGDNFASSSVLAVSDEAKALWKLKETEIITIPMRTLDDVWRECVAGEILDLLKLDVQGYEPQVLMGGEGTLPKTRVIVAEMSFFREYKEQWLFRRFYEFLNDRGFELSAMYEITRRNGWAPLQCNGVFVNTRMQEVA